MDLYLQYVEDTESPRIFHIWSALSGVAACLGRRVYFPFGIGPIYGNMYVLLVGPPAVKKSTSINIMSRLLSSATSIKFAPDDTSGKRQGLIKEMEGIDTDDEEEQLNGEIHAAINAVDFENQLGKINIQIPDHRDKHTLYVTASEFNTFIGHNQLDMITFLTKMYDGEAYRYRIKNERSILSDPLINLLAGTTPTNIASALPPESVGQGFTSRIILVFGNKKHRSIPRPSPLSASLGQEIEETFNWINYNLEGPMEETDKASKYLDELYEDLPKFNDPRFVYYTERRHIHLIKLSMCMAAARRTNKIEYEDVDAAISLLKATEISMPDALGEFGLSPLSAAKQKMVEFIRSANGPVPAGILWQVMQRDMKHLDFQNSLSDLTNSGKIIQANSERFGVVYIFKLADNKTDVNELLNHL